MHEKSDLFEKRTQFCRCGRSVATQNDDSLCARLPHFVRNDDNSFHA